MLTKKQLLDKGVKYLLYTLPLMFIGPAVVYNALINKQNNFHYVVLGVGIFLCVLAVLFMFKGVKAITDSFFAKK